MKPIALVLLLLAISQSIYAQTYPTCNDLSVDALSIDSAGNLHLTIRNTCYSCSYGGLGCVYNEIKVLKTSQPQSVIAESNCFCWYWADPNTHGEFQSFTFPSTMSALPPLSEIEVHVIGCGCDVIPFNPSLSIENNQSLPAIQMSFFPNPANQSLYIQGANDIELIQLYNATGLLVLSLSKSPSNHVIDVQHLPQGVYFLSVVSTLSNGVQRFIIAR